MTYAPALSSRYERFLERAQEKISEISWIEAVTRSSLAINHDYIRAWIHECGTLMHKLQNYQSRKQVQRHPTLIEHCKQLYSAISQERECLKKLYRKD